MATAMVIEDEFPLLRALEAKLERAGWDVITASDGKVGLELLEENLGIVKVVFLDIHMPELTGIDVLKHFVGKDHPPFIVISNSGNEAVERKRTKELGAEMYINKSDTRLSEIVKFATCYAG